MSTAWKVSKYLVFSGLYFPVFGVNEGKYGPVKTPYLDTFHEVVSKNIPYNVKKHFLNKHFFPHFPVNTKKKNFVFGFA